MSADSAGRPQITLVRPTVEELRREIPELERAITLAGQATDQLVELQGLADELLELAQEAHAEARADLEQQRERLGAFDQESERLLAETAGRVRSLRAKLQHRRGSTNGIPAGPGELAALEGELASAEQRDQALVSERLHGREWILTRFRMARLQTLLAGEARLALSGPHVESLRAIERTGRGAEEKRAAILGKIRLLLDEQQQHESSLRLVTPARRAIELPGEPDSANHTAGPASAAGGPPPC